MINSPLTITRKVDGKEEVIAVYCRRKSDGAVGVYNFEDEKFYEDTPNNKDRHTIRQFIAYPEIEYIETGIVMKAKERAEVEED